MSIYNDYNSMNFGVCKCKTKCDIPNIDEEYVPIFGVGPLIDSMIYSTISRPLQITDYALEHYNISVEQRNNVEELIGKTVAVIRRIVKDGVKIDEYHAPNYYEIKDINYKWMYSMSSVNLRNINTGVIEKEINIDRIAIPRLILKNNL